LRTATFVRNLYEREESRRRRRWCNPADGEEALEL
jgi:hypothetical protein